MIISHNQPRILSIRLGILSNRYSYLYLEATIVAFEKEALDFRLVTATTMSSSATATAQRQIQNNQFAIRPSISVQRPHNVFPLRLCFYPTVFWQTLSGHCIRTEKPRLGFIAGVGAESGFTSPGTKEILSWAAALQARSQFPSCSIRPKARLRASFSDGSLSPVAQAIYC